MVKLYQKLTDLIFLISKWFIQMQKKKPKNISNEDNQKKKPNLSISFGFLWQKAHFTIYILSNDNLQDHEMIYVTSLSHSLSLVSEMMSWRWQGGKNHTYVFFALDNADTVMFCKFFQYKEMWNDGFRWLEGNYQEMMFVLATFITFSRLSSITRYLHMQIFTNISIRTWYALAYCINNLTENRVEEN